MVAYQEREALRVEGAGRSGLFRETALLFAFYGFAVLLGFAIFVAITHAGLFGSVAIVFYRGLANLAVTALVLPAALTLIIRPSWHRGVLSGRDAVAGAIVAGALSLAALVVGPVTVDRSISIFLLSRLETAPVPLAAADLEREFAAIYVCRWTQLERRMTEQMASGNVEKTSAGYRLTPQGHAFMWISRGIASIFGTDPRFVGVEESAADRRRVARNQDCAPS